MLFKNRLFVERDVKNRRIQTVLGLTFRNSKWSSYARPNLSVKLTEDYTRLFRNVLATASFLFIVIFFSPFYVTAESLNVVSAFFWFFVDCFTFSYLFVYFTLSFLIQTLLSKLYSTLWLANISENGSMGSEPSLRTTASLQLPKHLQKYTLYTYLKQSGQQSVDLEPFFESTRSIDNGNARVLRQLYQTIGALKSSNSSTTQLSLTNLLGTSLAQSADTDSKVGLWASNSSSLTTHTHLLLNYFLLARSSNTSFRRDEVTPTSLSSLNRWNLYTVTPETVWKGNFYMNELNLNALNHLSSKSQYAILWSDAIREVVKSTKSQYWLYKYSTLHRAVFKNTHTLTVTKRLIGAGFFDSKLTKSNLWAANELQATANYSEFQERNKATMGLLYNVSKGLTDSLSVTNSLNTAGTDLNSLGLYQKSFDWFLTRSYNFSGLQSSLLSSGYTLSSGITTNRAAEDRQGQLRLTLTPYLKALTLSNNIYVGQSNVPSLNFDGFNSNNVSGNSSASSYTNRDLYLFYSSQSSYNSSTLQALTSLLQRHTFQSKRLYYPAVTTAQSYNVLTNYTFDTSLQAAGGISANSTLNSRLVSLEALFLQDLASATMYSQR